MEAKGRDCEGHPGRAVPAMSNTTKANMAKKIANEQGLLEAQRKILLTLAELNEARGPRSVQRVLRAAAAYFGFPLVAAPELLERDDERDEPVDEGRAKDGLRRRGLWLAARVHRTRKTTKTEAG